MGDTDEASLVSLSCLYEVSCALPRGSWEFLVRAVVSWFTWTDTLFCLPLTQSSPLIAWESEAKQGLLPLSCTPKPGWECRVYSTRKPKHPVRPPCSELIFTSHCPPRTSAPVRLGQDSLFEFRPLSLSVHSRQPRKQKRTLGQLSGGMSEPCVYI